MICRLTLCLYKPPTPTPTLTLTPHSLTFPTTQVCCHKQTSVSWSHSSKSVLPFPSFTSLQVWLTLLDIGLYLWCMTSSINNHPHSTVDSQHDFTSLPPSSLAFNITASHASLTPVSIQPNYLTSIRPPSTLTPKSPSVYPITISNRHRLTTSAHCLYSSTCTTTDGTAAQAPTSLASARFPFGCRQSDATPDRMRVAKVKLWHRDAGQGCMVGP